MRVSKSTGELVNYNPMALRRSLTKSGASKDEVDEVFDLLVSDLYDGMPTTELFDLAFEHLRKYRKSYAARYSLKRALSKLGPEGYYFEKYIKRLMESVGYNAINGEVIEGNAVTHEIDVIAQKEDTLYFIECKFRNDIEAKISVTTPMYFMSRMIDLRDKEYTYFGETLKPTKGFLVTNAYLTTDSVDWATYYNIGLISWNYPENMSLKFLIDNLAIYPVTCLTNLTKEQHKILLDNDCLLVKDILSKRDHLNYLDLSDDIVEQLILEAEELINIETIECFIA